MADQLATVTGRVLRWRPEDGWGVLESDELDGLVFAHYSAIHDQPGWRGLEPGRRVRFSWEQPGQDGCEYTAVAVFTTESGTRIGPPPATASGAYTSSLTIEFDQPRPT